MKEKNARLNYLFDLYKNHTASEKEVEELLNLINSESLDNRDLLYHEYEQANHDDLFFNATTSEKILSNILSGSKEQIKGTSNFLKLIHSYKTYLAAAIAIITFGLGFLLMLNSKARNEKSERSSLTFKEIEKIPPGGNKAILKLADGSVIILDNEKKGVLREQKNVSITKTAEGQIVFKVKNISGEENPSAYNSIETPKGGQYQVILPDNTIAWLNAASSIQFPTVFSGKYRKVQISGEVYFEVAKNASMPFIVKSRSTEIEVLGTHFNVMDYEDEKIGKTTLLEGEIKILNQKESKVLKPGQQAIYGEKQFLKLQSVSDPFKEIAWKNGFFEFKDTSIDVVMRQVARWYDVKVVIDRPIEDNEFTGKISRGVNLNEFLKILSYAGFNFKIEGQSTIIIIS